MGNWTQTLANIGIPFSPDANGGEGWGAFIATSTINPTNWTRSYSRSAYINPLPPRSNLDILANATVTRLLFGTASGSDGLTATGVEYASSNGAAKQTVKVNKEVILAGGAVGSPQVLLLSGVGPKDVLQAANVDVKVELPGVGQHLQDHIVCYFFTRDTLDAHLSSRAPKLSGRPLQTPPPRFTEPTAAHLPPSCRSSTPPLLTPTSLTCSDSTSIRPSAATS